MNVRDRDADAAYHHRFVMYQLTKGWPADRERAALYLDALAREDPEMCETVMKMLEFTTGVSWTAIKNS